MAREGRRPRRDKGAGLAQAPFRQLRNPYPPFEILSADQIEAHPPCLAPGAGRDRHEFSARRGAPDPQGGRLRGRPGGHAGALRPGLDRGPDRGGAGRVHAARAQPRAQRPRRRQRDQFFPGRERAARLRPRGRPADRQLRRLLQPSEARPEPQHLPHARGLPGRAGRPAARDPPSRCARGHGDADRPHPLRLRAGCRAHPRFARDHPDRPPGDTGAAARRALDDDRRQRQLAAASTTGRCWRA